MNMVNTELDDSLNDIKSTNYLSTRLIIIVFIIQIY